MKITINVLDTLITNALSGQGSGHWLKGHNRTGLGEFPREVRIAGTVRTYGKPEIERAIGAMVEKYPEILGRILARKDDDSDRNVFLQMCAIGEVIYV